MISVRGVSKRFGGREALRGVSFEVADHSLCGLVGPNGAGKTTTLRILSGFLSPDAGQVVVAGVDILRDPHSGQEQIGYLPESAPLYPEMRVADYLRFRAGLKNTASIRKAVAQSIARAGLAEVEKDVIGRLSKGFRQRVGVADALLGDPRVLLLDEPTSGLDPVQVREFRALLTELATEHTVLFCSHILSEVEALCERVVILSGGSVAGQGTLGELRAEHNLDASATLEQIFIASSSGNSGDTVLNSGQA